MAYCSRCGVEVEAHRNSCPLCDVPIHRYDEEEIHTPLWPIQKEIPIMKKRQKRFFMVLPLQVIFLIASLIVITVDLRMNGYLSWSRYPVTAITSLFLITIGVILCGNSKILTLGWITASTLAMLSVLDSFNGFTWFPTLGFPLTLIAGLYGGVTLLASDVLGRRLGAQLTLQALLVTLLCMSIDTVISQALGTAPLTWSLIVAAPLMVLFSLGLLGIFVLKRFIDLEKYLHR